MSSNPTSSSGTGFWSSETMQARLPELVAPFDPVRVVNCSYELRMGTEAFVTGTDEGTRQDRQLGQQLVIPPGQFAQLLTLETIKLPPDSLGLISMKSGLKLRGLVNVSGFHVDPGYQGKLLFSVYNAGSQSIVLSAGNPTFLLWCAFLDIPTVDTYEGKRAGLERISDEDIMRIQGDTFTPQALAQRVGALEDRISFRHDLYVAFLGAAIGILVTLAVSLIGLSLNSSSNESINLPTQEPPDPESGDTEADRELEDGDVGG